MSTELVLDRVHGLKIPVNLMALASAATNGEQDKASFVAPYAMKLEAAYLAFIAALTGAATNHPKFSIINKGAAGTGTTEMAALAFATTAVTAGAGAPKALTLSTTPANLLVAAGDIIAIVSEQVGTGKVHDICYPSVHFSFI